MNGDIFDDYDELDDDPKTNPHEDILDKIDREEREYFSECEAKEEWENRYIDEITNKAKQLICAKKYRCKKRNIPFDLDVDWLRTSLDWNCALTKIPFQYYSGVGNPYSPSIDRIDPDGGYLKKNCRVILLGLNNMKLRGTDEDLYKICKAFVKNYEKNLP